MRQVFIKVKQMNSVQIQTKQLPQIKEIPYFEGVCFDPDTDTIHGNYADEISAYRAKKAWLEAFRFNFSLKGEQDLVLAIETTEMNSFVLSCRFFSSTAKYAFWKITNNQSPEVQYIIETAHIPICNSRYEEILSAPDLRSVYDLTRSERQNLLTGSKLSEILQKIVNKK